MPPRVCPTLEACGIAGNGILLGDSHADRFEEALTALGATQGVGIIFPFKPADGGLQTQEAYSEDIRELITRFGPNAEGSDYAIINYNWSIRLADGPAAEDQRAMARGQIATLSDGGRRRILIVGPMIDYGFYVPQCTLRAEAKGLGWSYCTLPKEKVFAERAAALEELAAIMETLPNARYIDPIGLFCDEEVCRSWVDQSLLYADSNHLSVFGARYVVSNFADDFLWAMTGRETPVAAQ